MSASVAAFLKQIAASLLTNKKVLKFIGGVTLGVIIIVCIPIYTVVGIFSGDITIDLDRFQELLEQNRCIFFCDEFGTLPKIESAEMMFSASRSRRLQIVPIIQSFSQLDKNYGKEGAEIIVDNTQLTIFGGFAPNSSSAEVLSKALGSRTVMSGSVSRGKDNPSESLQMMERPLLTPDELKSLPKGSFVVMKTGVHPMQVKLKLFFEWGIQFDEDNPYTVPEHGNRKVEYAEKKEIMDGIVAKYHPDWLDEPIPADDGDFSGGKVHVPAEFHEPQQHAPRTPDNRRARGTVNPAPLGHKTPLHRKPEVKSDGQV